jgi:hypothetical protein
MPTVELQRQLSVPVVPARSALSAIMHEIVDERGSWSDFALYVSFGRLGLPDVGYVAIPVTVSDLNERLEPRHEISFTIRSRRSPEAFPVFKGALGLDASGPSSSLVWLGGEYEPPAKTLGAVFDAMVARSAAQASLQNMLHELAAAVESRVTQRETNAARYRLIFSMGD